MRAGERALSDEVREPGIYPIGYVARLTGLTPRQIRYYEREGLLEPQRTPGGHRLYSDDDVARLLAIRRLMQQGQSVQGIRALWQRHGPPRAVRRATPGAEDDAGVPVADLLGQLPGGRPDPSLYPLRHRDELLRRMDRRGRPSE